MCVKTSGVSRMVERLGESEETTCSSTGILIYENSPVCLIEKWNGGVLANGVLSKGGNKN